MQPLIEGSRGASGWDISVLLGLLLLGIVAIQAVWVLYSTVRRVYWQNRQFQLSTVRLERLIEAANIRVRQAQQAGYGWRGYRKFSVAKKERECEGVFSFYLEPHDRKPLPPFRPGQHLTFRLQLPGVKEDVVRCYSLSDSSGTGDSCKSYRVTIKKVPRPPGVCGSVSCFFCDDLKEGDIVDVEAPAGDFYLEAESPRPTVLIAGGVGVTPMVTMLNALLESGSKREIWFFYVIRNGDDHIFREYLGRVAAEHPEIHFHTFYTKPKPDEQLGRDYQHLGRLSVAQMKELLPSSNYEFFICGPDAMMNDIQKGLQEWGVPKKYVRAEAFGAPPVAPLPPTTGTGPLKVTFSKSGKSLTWDPQTGNLLQFALGSGISIRAGCRAGSCGSCLVAVKSGEVKVMRGEPRDDGSCLACICAPTTDLVLDA